MILYLLLNLRRNKRLYRLLNSREEDDTEVYEVSLRWATVLSWLMYLVTLVLYWRSFICIFCLFCEYFTLFLYFCDRFEGNKLYSRRKFLRQTGNGRLSASFRTTMRKIVLFWSEISTSPLNTRKTKPTWDHTRNLLACRCWVGSQVGLFIKKLLKSLIDSFPYRFAPIIGQYKISDVADMSYQLYKYFGRIVRVSGLIGRPDLLFIYDLDETEKVSLVLTKNGRTISNF